MTLLSALDSAGRRRSPATLPGYHAGRPPRNKGVRYPVDPPTVEEIVAVMRQAADDRHGWRLRAMIVVLWRAGLRIQEALALAEHDVDPRRGSLRVRDGKGGKRREVGMDEWGWEQLRPWLRRTRRAARRAALLVIDRPTAGDPGRAPRSAPSPPARSASRRPASLRAAPAAPRARARARPRRRPAQHHPAPTRARQPRHDLDLSARNRPRGDHRSGARTTRPDDVGQRRAAALSDRITSGSAPALPLCPGRAGVCTWHARRARVVYRAGRRHLRAEARFVQRAPRTWQRAHRRTDLRVRLEEVEPAKSSWRGVACSEARRSRCGTSAT
jgi:Phage integrase family